MNSEFLNGLEIKEAISLTCDKIEEMGIGQVKINYKMRDANFSRQRYWGEPFPIVYNEEGVPQIVHLSELPVMLPETNDFKPTKDGQSPLSRIESWVNVDNGTRETDTMPAVAGSSWYFLRYMDPNNDEVFASPEALKYWDSVDLYVGGSEHAVAHLLYARFWHKFLYDLNILPSKEPFKKLINQGMIQGVIEFIALDKDADEKTFYSADALEENSNLNISRIPVHIDYVSDYGLKTSYLNQEGIRSFLNWRPEFEDAKFVIGGKTYSAG